MSIDVEPASNGRPLSANVRNFLSPEAMWLRWKEVLGIGPSMGRGGLGCKRTLCHRCRTEIAAMAREHLAATRAAKANLSTK